MAENTFYSWNTKKVANGFQFTVSENTSHDTPDAQGSYVEREILKQSVCKSRVIAKNKAVKWIRYFKTQQKAA